jgi:murein L,D-transpeptidase YcbB/YkuD
MTHWRWVALLVATLVLPASASPASAEVPVPPIAPPSDVSAAGLGPAGRAPLSMGPRLPLPKAIEREVRVDVSRAVAELYARRDHAPLWDAAREDALRERLAAAARDGLDPADYAVAHDDGTAASRAREDVSLTEAALRYARHAHSGRVAPSSISRIVSLEPPRLDADAFLARIAAADAQDIATVLESAHPKHPQYRALRQALREALTTPRVTPVSVGEGPNLKLGVRSRRVAALRSRLGATVRRGTDPRVFDARLRRAVMDFQRANGLAVDGIVGPRTLAALEEGITDDPVPALVANMERWRWMPRDLGDHHVLVNVPAFRVRVSSEGETTWSGKVIVGRPGNPTPVFSDVMEHVVVNPYWNVPYSIAAGEMLPGLRADPAGYAARRNLEVVHNGRVVNPAALSWNRRTLRQVRIRQRPGRGNALGAVKFLFPNEYAVYLHDTPSKHLFRRERRAYSHGCVRVDDPFRFADALLATVEDLSGRRLERMAGGKRRWLNLDRPIPVHLGYFTRWVAEDGTIERHEDLYGFDRRTQRALGA